MTFLQFFIFISSGIVFFGSCAAASEHTGYWNQITPEGREVKCEEVTSEGSLEKVLEEAGWNNEEGIPRIDWSRDEAVVVAPSKYYVNGRMVFFALERRGDVIVLDYGWKSLGKRVATHSSSTVGVTAGPKAGPQSGRSGEGAPTTIVISYRKNLDDGLKFNCLNRGLIH